MPRLQGNTRPPASPPQPSRAAYDGLDDQVGEPGPMPTPSAVEEVFESGLDDLDMAFSRLDPVAPPSRLDADTASDFQRDLQELRSTTPAPVEPFAPPPPSVSVGPAVSHLPIADAVPVEADDLKWDLPTPATVVEAIPLPASFPSEPEPVVVPVVEVRPVEVIAAPEPEPEPPAPLPPPAPPAPPAPPPSLSTAFAALLAAEQAQPGRLSSAAGPVVPEGEIEDVVRRVVTRMTEEVVHKMVHESAERLIREEMAKFKR